MSNIVRVTEYLRGVLAEAGEDSENRVLTCIPTVTGEFMFRDDQDRDLARISLYPRRGGV